MRAGGWIWVGLAMAGLAGCAPKPPEPPPAELAWAYPKAPKADFPELGKGPLQIPGSPLVLTAAQIEDGPELVDWFPNEHPPAPPIVTHRAKGGPMPCGECHEINGQGFLGAPNLAGLPAAYIVEQIAEFRAGRRQSAEPGRPATAEMTKEAKAVSDPDVAQAAAYFAALKRDPWIRVVVGDTVPVTRADYYGWLDAVADRPGEPIGGRVIELPEDFQRMLRSDPHSGVVAYVPLGALARGEALARTGGASGAPCRGCHGADLKGGPIAPPLAGRSAAYLARMLWDIRSGARGGPVVAQMQGPARNLTPAQITDLAAYLASLAP